MPHDNWLRPDIDAVSISESWILDRASGFGASLHWKLSILGVVCGVDVSHLGHAGQTESDERISGPPLTGPMRANGTELELEFDCGLPGTGKGGGSGRSLPVWQTVPEWGYQTGSYPRKWGTLVHSRE